MEFVCRKVLAHRERLRRLLERGDIYYDRVAAERAVLFIEHNVCHWKNPFAGKPFILAEWQKEDVIKPLFGFKWRASGLRVFREVYLQLARKNGKSSLAAAILLTLLFCGGAGSELYTAATKREQAQIIFNDCVKFVKNSPNLKARARLLKTEIQIPDSDSTLKPLSADEKSLDGLNISAASIDELHKHRTAYVHDVIVTGTGARTQPMILNVTTAGDNMGGVCYELYERSARILEELGEEDPSFFCYICEADADVDWRSEQAIRQANPNYPISPNPGYIEKELKSAVASPRYRAIYFKYTLNRWAQSSGVAWLSLDKWKACAARYDEDDLAGCNLWLGADLSKTTDLSALAGIAELTEERWSKAGDLLLPGLYHLAWNYLPAERIEDVDEREAPYKIWVEQGWVTPSGTSSIDIDVLEEKVAELAGKFHIVDVGIDSNRGLEFIKKIEAGLGREDVIKVKQGMRDISETCKNFEKMINEGKIRQNGNPCMAWQVREVKIRCDNSGNIKPVKGYEQPSGKRIDAIYATIDALYARENGAGVSNVYEYSGMG